MQLIERGIFYEDSFLGVTVGGITFSHGTIMIDAPLRPEDARAWRSVLHNVRGGASRLMVSLDAHLDRTLGARSMECTIISHQKTAQTYRDRPVIFKGQTLESGADWENYNDAIGTRWVSPDITFSQQILLHWGGPNVLLEHHPGPAPGAIWVIIPEEQIVFIGDAVVPDQPPFFANADLLDWIETLELLSKSYKNYVVIGGRGGPVTRDQIRSQMVLLKKVARQVERLAAKNASSEKTEEIIPGVLADLSFPVELQEKYTQRLRAGLYQYYTRLYRPHASIEPADILEPLE
jgi:glyoxylase-like metal-dependent hydrolase (beta-lactamase superfamily II)